ncbi:MAG: O-methyltransferase [Bacteroidales bacterium]|nr:O-methyltransferase [Bacteroidales bacterium]
MIDKDKLFEYISNYSSDEEDILAELNRQTHLKVLNPRMLSGKVQGQLLKFISYMVKPKYILEIGTYTGYSAICLAHGLKDGGQLHTIECNDEITGIATKYFEKAGLKDKIKLHVGDALEIIPGLEYDWDIVFMDADKKTYSTVYDMIIDKMKPGAFILADNVLWSGKVVDKNSIKNDIDTKSILEFNEKVKNDPRVENVIVGIRDGISLIRKC